MVFKRSYSRRSNALSNLVSNVWIALMSIVSVPFYLKYVGVEAYGLIGVFATLQAFIFLLDFGLSPTLSRELARLSTDIKNADEMADLTKTLEVPNFVSGCLIALFLCSLSPLIANYWLHPENLSNQTVTRSLTIIGAIVGLNFILTLYSGGLMGLQKQLPVAAMNVLFSTLRSLGGIFVLVYYSPTLETLVGWQFAVTLFQVVTMIAALNFSLPVPSIKGHFTNKIFIKIWRFAAGTTGISFVSLILSQTDKVILSKTLTLQMFGFYTLASSVANMALGTVIGAISQAVYPRLSQLIYLKEDVEMARFYHISCQVISVITFPIMGTLIYFSKEILTAWTHNPQIANETSPLMSLLVLGTGLNGLMVMPYFLQLANGTTKRLFYLNVCAVVILIPFILIGVSFYGAIGGALGWVFLNIFYLLIGGPILHQNVLPSHLRQWYLFDLGLPCAAAFVVAGMFRLVMPRDVSDFELIVIVATAACTSFCFAVLSAKSVRNAIRENIKLYFGAQIIDKL